MNTQKNAWVIAVLAAAVGVLGTLVAVNHGGGAGAPVAYGQTSEGVGAGYVVGILGPAGNDRLPLFLVDTKSQTILVYEYMLSRRRMFLRQARSFSADRELQDKDWGQGDQYSGPSVKDVQKIVGGK